MADHDPVRAWRRSAAAVSTLGLLTAISWTAWISARPPVAEAADTNLTVRERADTAMAASTTTIEAAPRDDFGDTEERDELGLPDRFRLVYEVERNDGSRTERVHARDGRRWSFRDDEVWFVHAGEATDRCLIGHVCQRSVGSEPPVHALLLWDRAAEGTEPRTIAGMPARCATSDLTGGTVCRGEDGLLLLSDPGPDAMQPSAFRSERVELVDVGEPRESDFARPSE